MDTYLSIYKFQFCAFDCTYIQVQVLVQSHSHVSMIGRNMADNNNNKNDEEKKVDYKKGNYKMLFF